METWYYGNKEEGQVGPVSRDQILQLSREGAIQNDTLVWCPTITGQEWRDFASVLDLVQGESSTSVFLTANSKMGADTTVPQSSAAPDYDICYYQDVAGAQCGPVPVTTLASLWDAEFIDASSLVWTPSMTSWLPLAQATSLHEMLGSRVIAFSEANKNIPVNSDHDAVQNTGADSDALTDEEDGSKDNAKDLNEGGDSEPKKRKRKKKKKPKQRINTWIFVRGLPPDVTHEELETYFKKAGLLRVDVDSGMSRINIYREKSTPVYNGENGVDLESFPCNGTASIAYLKPESVALAIELFDAMPFRDPVFDSTYNSSASKESENVNDAERTDSETEKEMSPMDRRRKGYPLIVEPGDLEYRASEAGSKRPSDNQTPSADAAAPQRKSTKRDQAVRIRQLQQEAKLSWDDEGDGSSGLRMVVLRNMFLPSYAPVTPETANRIVPETEPSREQWLKELEADIISEMELSCGVVEKAHIFPNHMDGVVLLRFKTPSAAALCLEKFDGRFFAGAKIHAEFWDGITQFGAGESEEKRLQEEKERMDAFGQWLEGA